MPALWVYKCNSKSGAEGHWDYFFDDSCKRRRWGGTDCIKNAASQKILREKLSEGDSVLAWQSDERAAYGMCRVHAIEYEGDETYIVLEKVQRFASTVKLLEWKKRSKPLANGKAFMQGNAGTLFETTVAEANEILRICGVRRQQGRDR